MSNERRESDREREARWWREDRAARRAKMTKAERHLDDLKEREKAGIQKAFSSSEVQAVQDRRRAAVLRMFAPMIKKAKEAIAAEKAAAKRSPKRSKTAARASRKR